MNQDINVKLWYEKFSQVIDIKYRILLVLAALHYHKHISDEKLKGQFSSLRKGNLQKFKKTYHCDITNRWYNEEEADKVFLDCINYKKLTTIPFKEFIKYIAMFENKGYNYALNVFGSECIYSLFNYWDPKYSSDDDFCRYIDFEIPGIEYSNDIHTCNSCGHTHTEYSKDSDRNIRMINNWLHDMKKGNLSKIPKYDVRQSRW